MVVHALHVLGCGGTCDLCVDGLGREIANKSEFGKRNIEDCYRSLELEVTDPNLRVNGSFWVFCQGIFCVGDFFLGRKERMALP